MHCQCHSGLIVTGCYWLEKQAADALPRYYTNFDWHSDTIPCTYLARREVRMLLLLLTSNTVPVNWAFSGFQGEDGIFELLFSLFCST